jgi:heat shock protein HslJ
MRSVLTITLCLFLTACTATQKPNTSEENPALIGVLWELSKIQSMDDSAYVPRAPGLYTLEFHHDGSVAIRADCNRGRGNWASETASQLSITQLATTRAMCIPRSLHDRFISDLNYTRSFTLNEGKLYLATMADGAILEFFPSRAMHVE